MEETAYGVSSIQTALLGALRCPPPPTSFLTELTPRCCDRYKCYLAFQSMTITHSIVSAHIVFEVLNQIIFAIIQIRKKQILFIMKCYKAF